MRSVKFVHDVYDPSGALKFAAGNTYPLDDETRRYIDLNMADEVAVESKIASDFDKAAE